MKKRHHQAYLVLDIVLVLLFSTTLAPASLFAEQAQQIADNEIRIGVLALRGKEKCRQQWDATAAYLTEKISDKNFSIVPLDFDEMSQFVGSQKVDFTITNSSMYVNLEYHFGESRMATMKTKTSGMGMTQFGGVIFYRSDRRDIQSAKDLVGKRFMAVDEKSFGGWHMAWRYLLNHGIDPQKRFKEIRYGDTHDAVVMAVLDKRVDAGTIRTGILEKMAQEGKIQLDQFKVLDAKAMEKAFPEFKLLHTTTLYPEWPFAKLPHTSDELAKEVSIALLQMRSNNPAAKAAGMVGWTIPLDYQPVHDCLKAIKFAPYDVVEQITFQQLIKQYKPWLIALSIFILFGVITLINFGRLNRRLRLTMTVLDHELTQRKRIQNSLNEFKITLDQILDCVFMFEPEELRFIYVNQGAMQQVEYSSEDLFTMTPIDIEPDFTEKSFHTMLIPLLNGDKKSLTFTTEHLSKSGKRIPVEIFLQYVQTTDEGGRYVAIVRDISQRLQEAKEKEALQSQLLHTQKLESVGQLAAGIAHEINTPTQFITSNIEFLEDSFQDLSTLLKKYHKLLTAAKKDGIPSDLIEKMEALLEDADWEFLAEELPQSIEQTKDGAHRISTIVRAMKEFSHPGSKDKTMLSLEELINTTLIVCRNEWKYVADVKTDFPENLPMVPCLSDEMGQVILNLLVNSAHAIAKLLGDTPNEEKGTITLSLQQVEDTMQIRVQDTGCGIPTDIQDKVFDPFFTTKAVGKGTGQGLAIARDVIVNKHGGTLTVESKVGEGSTFLITLPLTIDMENQ